jgi:hypothetical protein
MRRLPLFVSLPLIASALLFAAHTTAAQTRRASGFRGSWNYAVYAKEKSELPPAYQSMSVEEVPEYAIDITIKQSGNRLRATCGIAARYLAKIDDCAFTATVRNGAAQFRLKSSFGGTSTIRLTVRGDRLYWKVLRHDDGESYIPGDIVLRRLKPGETPPYFEKDAAR